MDKAKAYSILVTWADFADNPARSNWCRNEMKKMLLQDLIETENFYKVQKDGVYLDLLSQLLPDVAYLFQDWGFIRSMEAIEALHDSQTWQKNLALAREKIKRPDPDDHRQPIIY